MKLTYRGISYTPTSVSVHPIETQLIGKYRGSTFVIHNHEAPAIAQMNLNLKYRGAHYHPIAPAPIDLIFAPA